MTLPSGTATDSERLAAFVASLPHGAREPRRRPSARYILGVLAAVIAVVLVPLLYVATVLGAAAGWLWWLMKGEAALPVVLGRVDQGGLILYAGPLVVGAALVAALLRPFFLRNDASPPRVRLTETDDPLAFALVHRMCDAAGAPRLTAIDLSMEANACAIPRDGWKSVFTGEFSLGLGAPVIACFDVRQLTSVIGHELGHCVQRHGVRVYCLVHAVTDWIRRGTAPPEWHGSEEEHDTSSFGWLLFRAGAWVSRAVLRAVWFGGQVPASFLSRQKERGADDAALLLAGPDALAETATAFPRLAAALEVALSRLHADGVVPPRDISSWVHDEFARGGAPDFEPSDARTEAWLASHPSWQERVERVERARELGLPDGPGTGPLDDLIGGLLATALFEPWDEHAGAVTASYLAWRRVAAVLAR